jgi:hypothetical protein
VVTSSPKNKDTIVELLVRALYKCRPTEGRGFRLPMGATGVVQELSSPALPRPNDPDYPWQQIFRKDG